MKINTNIDVSSILQEIEHKRIVEWLSNSNKNTLKISSESFYPLPNTISICGKYIDQSREELKFRYKDTYILSYKRMSDNVIRIDVSPDILDESTVAFYDAKTGLFHKVIYPFREILRFKDNDEYNIHKKIRHGASLEYYDHVEIVTREIGSSIAKYVYKMNNIDDALDFVRMSPSLVFDEIILGDYKTNESIYLNKCVSYKILMKRLIKDYEKYYEFREDGTRTCSIDDIIIDYLEYGDTFIRIFYNACNLSKDECINSLILMRIINGMLDRFDKNGRDLGHYSYSRCMSMPSMTNLIKTRYKNFNIDYLDGSYNIHSYSTMTKNLFCFDKNELSIESGKLELDLDHILRIYSNDYLFFTGSNYNIYKDKLPSIKNDTDIKIILYK